MDRVLDRTVSFSEISTWQTCRQRWHYAYQRLLVPRVDSSELLIGSAVHHYLEAEILKRSHYQESTSWLKVYLTHHDLMFGEEEYLILENIDSQAKDIVNRACEFINIDSWKTVTTDNNPIVEYQFVVPLKNTGGLKGIIDWVAYDSNGRIWLIEHKTRKTLTEDDGAFFLQLPVYQEAMSRAIGLEITGTCVLQMSRQMPSKPQLNKNGSMSKVLIKTTWDIYKQDLLNNGLDPKDYWDMKPKLDEVQFFKLIKYQFSETDTSYIWNKIVVPTVMEISNCNVIYRSRNNFNCVKCSYRALCDAELFDDDVKSIEEGMYTINQKKVDELERASKSE